MSIEGLIKNQLGSGGGAEQHHGRPLDSQGVPDKVQLKKKRLFGRAKWRHGRPPGFKGPTTISPTIHDRPQGLFYALSEGYSSKCYERHSYRYLFLSAFSVVSTPGSAASAAKHDETSMKSPAPRTLSLP